MKKSPHGAVCGILITLGSISSVNAALIDRGNGLIYDNDLDVTWLADANYAMTSGYDDDGRMSWFDATDWAAQLTYQANGVIYDDWRLANADTSCSGYNCTNSEIGHLFYNELGGTSGYSILASTDPDLALFLNLQSDYYWTGNEHEIITGNAWSFLTSNGSQDNGNKYNSFFALAVRDGDIAVVPVPAAAWLFASGLIAISGFVKKRKRN